MNKKPIIKTALFIIVLILLCNTLFAQTGQLNLKVEARKIKYVSIDVQDAQGNYCSALRIISDIQGLQYDSYLGIVQIDDLENEDIVFVLPQEKAIELYHRDYEPYKINFTDYGIQLNPKEMWEIKISEGSQAVSTTQSEIQVTIKTNPPLTKYYIDGNYMGVNESFNIAPGQHLLEIKKLGYATLRKNIFVSSTNNFFQYELEKEGQPQPVPQTTYTQTQPESQTQSFETETTSTPATGNVGSIKIESNPSDAEIFLNGNKIPKKSPALISNLVFGEYKIMLKKPGYTGELTVNLTSSEQKSIFVDLNPLYGKIDVQSKPDNSDIYLDGNLVGRTPMVIENVTKGFHTIKIQKNDFSTMEDVINISAGSVYNYTKNIEQLATLEIKSNPEKVRINIDDKLFLKTPWKGDLASGSHKINFSKPNYFEKNLDVNLAPGERKTLNIILDPNMLKLNKRLTTFKRIRNISLYTSVAATIAGAAIKYSADQDYDAYQKAGSDARSLHDSIELKDKLYPAVFGAGAALLIPTVYSHFKVRKLNSQINVGYDYHQNAHELKLVFNLK
jgi:hypothetical protein